MNSMTFATIKRTTALAAIIFLTVTMAFGQQKGNKSDTQKIKNNDPSEESIRAIAELRNKQKQKDSSSVKKNDHFVSTNPNEIVVSNLKGRELISVPTNMTDIEEEGMVIVEIVVDEKGNVIRSKPGLRGSTTASPKLWARARQASFLLKFSKSSGEKEQTGTYIFIFRLE